MILDNKIITAFNERPIFQKVVFETPMRYKADLVDENRACFFYIVDGKYETTSWNGKTSLSSHEGIVKKCGNYIANYVNNGEKKTCEAIAIYFYQDVINEVFGSDANEFYKNRNHKFNKIRPSNVLFKKYIESLMFYFENEPFIDDDIIKLKLKELILLIMKTELGLELLELIGEFFNPDEVKIKDIIKNNIYNELSIDELAFLSNMSLSSFKRNFFKIYNTTPAKYIRKQKLIKVESLLINTNKRINDIAFECGVDVANISTLFRKEYGYAPKEYRIKKKKLV